MIYDILNDNTILVVKEGVFDKVVQSIRNNSKLLNIKFMTMDDIRKNLYFSYDDRAIYYLIKKYNCDYDVCVKYLKNLYYLVDINIDNKKVNKLKEIKSELEDNGLIYTNLLFKEYLKGKKVIIYNYINLSKYDKLLVDEIKKITDVCIYNDEHEVIDHRYVYSFSNIFDEVSFVAGNISKLIHDGVDINNIKICGINDEYKVFIKKVFSFFKIPIYFNDNYLYSTVIGQDFLNNFAGNFEESLGYIYNKYNMKDENILCIYNDIVDVINKYVFCDDMNVVLEMIIHDFKNKKINVIKCDREIEIINSLDGITDEYVFLMNFNQGMIPSLCLDLDYLSDDVKGLLNIDTSYDLNKYFYDNWLFNIKRCKNLIISYKTSSLSGSFYLSSLNDDLNLEIVYPDNSYVYSNIYNKIRLTSDIDNLIKYNTTSFELELLFNNYTDISYMSYNNRYTHLNKMDLRNFLGNNLVLSYSSINDYYHCAFKYYLSYVLRLNVYKESFYTIVGNLFHYILSICFVCDIDLRKEYDAFIDKQSYVFDSREMFFLNNLFDEMIFVIDTIKKQYSFSSFSRGLYEDKIEVLKSRDGFDVIFKGFIDKILLDDDNRFAAIVDYKTGNTNINLNNSIYGLDLQLPIYVYLTKYKFPDIRIVGFYLQKILNGLVVIDDKKDFVSIKEDRLKLQGYSNCDQELIGLLDSNYSDSKVIKGMRVTSKGLSCKNVLDDITIDNLVKLTDSKINSAIDDIMDANFTINPKVIDGDNIGCMYCKYRDICFVRNDDFVNLAGYKDISFLNDFSG